MKKAFSFAFLIFTLSICHAQSNQQSVMEISFDFGRKLGVASNQFAVWIEDSRGTVVKTLYATRFTASGGWQRRPLSIPVWVKKSGLSALGKNEVDAFTGATPRTGTLTYRWDGRDKNGNSMAAGEYRVFLEATLRNENGVLYNAPFTIGVNAAGNAIREAAAEYTGNSTRDRDMVKNVKVSFRP